jgi:hypothetical protein
LTTTFDVTIDSQTASIPLRFNAARLVCCGWVGRDRAALQAHIDELGVLGVLPPTRVPIYMNFSTSLLTTDRAVDVVSDTTSGEVEYVLLRQGRNMWVTVGSDQTDRHIETHSIVASKQMCAKYLAERCWPYDEVERHWDQLVLRCWITKGGRRTLYQDAPLASILAPHELLENLPDAAVTEADGVVLYSGTVATKSELIFGDRYELELQDPVLGRTIRGEYAVTRLAQHI